jgi:hypothetical protein
VPVLGGTQPGEDLRVQVLRLSQANSATSRETIGETANWLSAQRRLPCESCVLQRSVRDPGRGVNGVLMSHTDSC